MKKEIKDFILKVNKRYGTEALYFPDNDVYSIRFRGRAVQNFNSKAFYMLPKQIRFRKIGDILYIGLNHNMGEKSLQDQLYLNRSIGTKIK